MTRDAAHVTTRPVDVARLQALIGELGNGAHVRLHLADGSEVHGTVAARPVAQVFFGPDGEEGTNAVVRLEEPMLEPSRDRGWRDVWLDQIVKIERLD